MGPTHPSPPILAPHCGRTQCLAKLASVKARLCRSLLFLLTVQQGDSFLCPRQAGRQPAQGIPSVSLHQGSLGITPVPKSGVCLQPRPHFCCSLMTLAYFCYCTGLSSQCLSVCPAPSWAEPASKGSCRRSLGCHCSYEKGGKVSADRTDGSRRPVEVCSAPLSPGCPSMCR